MLDLEKDVKACLKKMDACLQDAHTQKNHYKLVEGYYAVAEFFFKKNDVDKACFYLTHAYVYALVSGHKNVCEIHKMLCFHGREERHT